MRSVSMHGAGSSEVARRIGGNMVENQLEQINQLKQKVSVLKVLLVVLGQSDKDPSTLEEMHSKIIKAEAELRELEKTFPPDAGQKRELFTRQSTSLLVVGASTNPGIVKQDAMAIEQSNVATSTMLPPRVPVSAPQRVSEAQMKKLKNDFCNSCKRVILTIGARVFDMENATLNYNGITVVAKDEGNTIIIAVPDLNRVTIEDDTFESQLTGKSPIKEEDIEIIFVYILHPSLREYFKSAGDGKAFQVLSSKLLNILRIKDQTILKLPSYLSIEVATQQLEYSGE